MGETAATGVAVGGAPRDGLDVRLLGRILVTLADGRTPPLGTRTQRAVLAILALSRGQVVSADRLVDELWGDEPPSRALSSLYPYISNLRRILEPARGVPRRATVLVASPSGYALHLPPDSLDVARFETAAERASTLLLGGEHDQAAAWAERALAEWQGPALVDLAGEPFASGAAMRLEARRLDVTEDLFDAVLRRGDAGLVVDVRRHVAANPLRERAWSILVRALHVAGRRSDALDACQEARRALVDGLGVEPGAELRDLEQAILRHDTTLTPTPMPTPSPTPTPTVSTASPANTTAVAGTAGPARSPAVRETAASAAARAALDDATSGRSRTVLVSGAPGLGKTRLVEWLADEAAALGFRIATGRCDDDGTAPFAPWNDVLATLGHGVVGLSDSEVTSDVETGERRLVDELASRLRATLADGPLLVVVEDLHWADRSSLRCFEHVARQFRTERFLLVGTARDESVPEVRHMVGGLARAAGFVGVALEPLTRVEISELATAHAGRPLDEDDVDVIAERTAGNPFFVIELARWVGRNGTAGDGVPTGVVDVVRRQVSRLPTDVVDLLVIAAVVGQTFDVDVVASAAGVSVDRVFDLLDIAVVSRVIEPGSVRGADYAFVHTLVRDAIRLDLPPLRRARVHHRVAEAVAGRSPAASDLAVHRWEARSVAPEHARIACRGAARAAEAAYAVFDATRWWQRALELEPSADAERARVLLALGRSLGRMERLEERPSAVRADEQLTTDQLVGSGRSAAWGALLEAIDIALEVGDVATAAAAAIEVGSGWNAWHWCGFRTTPEEVNRRLEAVLGVLGDDRTRERAAVLANLAIGRYNDDPITTSDTLSLAAVDVARSTGDDQLIAHALLSRALAIERPGRDPDRRECVDGVLRLAGSTVEQQASALLIRAAINLRTADRLHAESDLAAVRRLARRHRMLREDIQTQIFEMTLAVVDGRPQRAEAIAVDAIERGAARMGDGGPLGFLALYSLRRAQGRLGELVDDARRFAPRLGVAHVDLVGPALLAQRRDDEAAMLARGADAFTDVPPDWYWLGQNVLRGEVAATVGSVALVRRQYELLADHAGSVVVVPGFVVLGIVDVVLGRLASSLGDPAAAITHLDDGAAIAERLGATTWAEHARRARAAVSGPTSAAEP